MFPNYATHCAKFGRRVTSVTATRILAFLFFVLISSCTGRKNEKRPQKPRVTRITIAGSSAMLPLVTEAANRYMLKHPDIAVDVSAGGSGRGARGGLHQKLL